MPQNVMVSVIGEGEYMPKMVRAILSREVIPSRNLFISAKNKAACQAAEGYSISICEDDLSALKTASCMRPTRSARRRACSCTSPAAIW